MGPWDVDLGSLCTASYVLWFFKVERFARHLNFRNDQIYLGEHDPIGSDKNAHKCLGLGHSLLQYFVDEVQSLSSRADSRMLIDKARQMRFYLVQGGLMESELPKLDGQNGINWFFRWRTEHSLTLKATGMQLKVAWRKVLRRCRVLMTNIFRLSIFFALCHPGGLLYLLIKHRICIVLSRVV